MPPKKPSPTSFFDAISNRVTSMVENLVEDLQDDAEAYLQQYVRNNTPAPAPGRAVQGRTKKRVTKTARRTKTAPQASQGASPGPKTPPRPASSFSPTLYDDLEVSPKASQETISAAFRSLAKKYHPDADMNLNGGLPGQRTEAMVKLSNAYCELKDPKKRKAYDRSIGL